MQNCGTVAKDLKKVFETYWQAAENNVIPNPWPKDTHTSYTMESPIKVNLNDEPTSLYFAAAPKGFDPPHRTHDIDALLSAINNAKKTVSIEVMDYAPSSLYQDPNIYWFVFQFSDS